MMKRLKKNVCSFFAALLSGLVVRFWGFLLWLDLGLAMLVGGSPREYPSAALFRKGVIQNKKRYLVMMWCVDWIFKKIRGQVLHCQSAFESIRRRDDMPKEYKD